VLPAASRPLAGLPVSSPANGCSLQASRAVEALFREAGNLEQTWHCDGPLWI